MKGVQKYTKEDLKEMQSWDLEKKIAVSRTRIIEFAEKERERGKGICISFSGGKDSTVLLDIVRNIYPDTKAIFCDTGMEFPEIRRFVKTFDNVEILHPIKWSKNMRRWLDTDFREIIEEEGYPVISKEVSQIINECRKNDGTEKGKYYYRRKKLEGTLTTKDGKLSNYNCPQWKFLLDAPFKISHKCCDYMKKNPAKIFARKNNLSSIIGTMASESKIRLYVWLMDGCNSFDSKIPKSKPLSFWTEQDILHYIVKYNLKYASDVYGEVKQDEKGRYYCTKRTRTGCMFCLFGLHLEKEPNRMQLLKEEHPNVYNQCMKPLDEGGLGLRDVIDWINENGTLKRWIMY